MYIYKYQCMCQTFFRLSNYTPKILTWQWKSPLFDGKYIFNMVDFTASHVSSLQGPNFPIKNPPLWTNFRTLEVVGGFFGPERADLFFIFFWGKNRRVSPSLRGPPTLATEAFGPG